jgi:hypothetical protein
MSRAGSNRPPMSKVRAMACPASAAMPIISRSSAATGLPAEHPDANGLGPVVGDGVGSGGGLVGGATDGEPDDEPLGEAEGAQPPTARTTVRRNPAGRRQPGGIGLVGVVLKAAHGGQGRVAQQLRLALEQGQLRAQSRRGIGCLQ